KRVTPHTIAAAPPPYATLFRSIKVGEIVVVDDLLYGLLLPSGNDASVALAEHFGAQWDPAEGESGYDRFIKCMNETAVELGLSKDRKSTRLNSSHVKIAYAHYC